MIRCLLELRREKMKPFPKHIRWTVERIFIISQNNSISYIMRLHFPVRKCLFILKSFISFSEKCSKTSIMRQVTINWIGGVVFSISYSPQALGWFSKLIVAWDIWFTLEGLGGYLSLILESWKGSRAMGKLCISLLNL